MRRVIFLVDMNAFFISCEATRNPALQKKPAAVAGNPKKRTGIILTANYKARAYGVKTAMMLHEARSLCPEMILVPPDHNFYEKKSREVMAFLSRYTPIIEQNSIDEAWLDMTGSGKLFGRPETAAKEIMAAIKKTLGLWCSIGIAENKFLAKMAAEMKKPLGVTALWPDSIEKKVWPLPVQTMYGVGKKTAKKLNRMGIRTIGELAQFDPQHIAKLLGKNGFALCQYARGEDPAPVRPRSADDMKSIGRSKTLPQDITDLEKAKVVLMELTESVAMKARKHDKKGATVQITLKYSDFQVITRQATVAPATHATKEIYTTGVDLLARNWRPAKPVRLIGISLTNFAAKDVPWKQMSLFDFIKEEKQTRNGWASKEEKIDQAMDTIRMKHGMEKISRGPF